MTDNKLLEQIGKLLSLQAATLRKEMQENKQELKQVMKESQEDTIQTLTELFHEGFGMHEKRIKRIEDHLHLSAIE